MIELNNNVLVNLKNNNTVLSNMTTFHDTSSGLLESIQRYVNGVDVAIKGLHK